MGSEKSGVFDFTKWFAAWFALVYVSGYIIEFTFYSVNGVTTMSGDVLKLKYVHTGIVFILFFSIVTVPFVLYDTDTRATFGVQVQGLYKYINRFVISPIRVVRIILFNLIIFCAVVFTPPQYVRSEYRIYYLILFVAISMIFNILYGRYIKRKRKKIRESGFRVAMVMLPTIVDVFLLAVAILFSFKIFSGMAQVFSEMLSASEHAGFLFFLWCFTIALLVRRFLDRISEETEEGDSNKVSGHADIYATQLTRGGFFISWIIALAVTFFLAVSTYAYTIFPYIPSLKGGGNYVGVPESEVQLTRASLTSPDDTPLKNVIVFYSTDTSVYFAYMKDEDGPCQWRSRLTRPSIVEIPRSQIRTITKLPPRSQNCAYQLDSPFALIKRLISVSGIPPGVLKYIGVE
ncbi:MAG: hypothetical protein ACLPWS_13755 [Rhodomicrobium sp.]